ncbi:MAG: NnrU family protein, partial [Pseudomonadota bacterium]
MIWILLGLAIWYGAHFFKRWAPDQRAAMSDRLGDGSKGVIAGALVVSIVLFWWGYRQAEVVSLWSFPWAVHLNNLLMIIAVILFGLGSSKSRFRAKMRHPMLTGFAVWAFAHLLVNGDLASLVM